MLHDTTDRPDLTRVHAGPARRHITALLAHGGSYRGIARIAGTSHAYIAGLDRGAFATVTADIDRRIRAVTVDQARPPRNHGGPGGQPWRVNADDLDVLASAGEDVHGAAARIGVQPRSIRTWATRSTSACPAAVRRALVARLDRNGITQGRRAA